MFQIERGLVNPTPQGYARRMLGSTIMKQIRQQLQRTNMDYHAQISKTTTVQWSGSFLMTLLWCSILLIGGENDKARHCNWDIECMVFSLSVCEDNNLSGLAILMCLLVYNWRMDLLEVCPLESTMANFSIACAFEVNSLSSETLEAYNFNLI